MNSYFGISVHDGKVGILDIGSNSIRLVVYDGMKRAPMPVFNEKAMCELGKNLGKTGKLHQEGVKEAKEAIARFLALSRVMDVVELYILATAAIRDAEDGKAFVKEIEQRYEVNVRIISGAQEARLAARGIQAALYEPEGLVGDLGGGSLELIRIHQNKISKGVSLPLGALRLKDESNELIPTAMDIVRKAYQDISWLKSPHSKIFYAVGGSFRTLAHIHLLQSHYPLEILHAYEVKTDILLPFLRTISLMEKDELAKLPGSSKKRASALPFAAVALAELLENSPIEHVVFSTAGIREGFLFDQLSPHLQQEDGLIASCIDLASQSGRVGSYARDLFLWIQPLFADESEHLQRLRFACCVLSEFAWRIHPQYRAEWLYTRIIQSSILCMNHRERVCIAGALYHRYTLKTSIKTKVLKLISAKDQLWCEAVGLAMSVGFSLSGGMAGILQRMELTLKEDKISVHIPADMQDLMAECVEKKLERLGEILVKWKKERRINPHR